MQRSLGDGCPRAEHILLPVSIPPSLHPGPRSSTCLTPHAARLPALSGCPRGSLSPILPPPLPKVPLSLPPSLQSPSSAAGPDPRGRLACLARGLGASEATSPPSPQKITPLLRPVGAGAAAREEGGRAAGLSARPAAAGGREDRGSGGSEAAAPGGCVRVRQGDAGGCGGTLTMAAERRRGAVQGIAGLGAALQARPPRPPYKAPPPPGPGAPAPPVRAGTGRERRPGLRRGTAGPRGGVGRRWGAVSGRGERLCGAVPSPTQLSRQMVAVCLCWNLPCWEGSIRRRATLGADRVTESVGFNLGLVYGPALVFTS